jgi:hypothetical protein
MLQRFTDTAVLAETDTAVLAVAVIYWLVAATGCPPPQHSALLTMCAEMEMEIEDYRKCCGKQVRKSVKINICCILPCPKENKR